MMSSLDMDRKRNTNHLLTNCRGLCDRAERVIVTNLAAVGRRENQEKEKENLAIEPSKGGPASAAFHAEMKLWLDLKKFKDLHDQGIFNYLHGYYVSLLQQVLLSSHGNVRSDRYFLQPVSRTALKYKPLSSAERDNNTAGQYVRLLIYNIQIRLGDLNRYLRFPKMAKLYYCQARELNPMRGHAYNQLALIATHDQLQQVYYYVRACSASEEPLSIAEANLKSAVAKYSSQNHLIKAMFDPEAVDVGQVTVSNWLYVSIITIHLSNVRLILKPLTDEAVSWLKKQIGLNPFSSSMFETNLDADSESLLPAIDVILDYLLLNQTEKPFFLDYEKEFKELKIEVTSLLSQSDNFAICCDKKALRHDRALLGFNPLTEIHEKLNFEAFHEKNALNSSSEFIFLIKRINDKVDKILAIMGEKKNSKKKSRNMALQSILGAN